MSAIVDMDEGDVIEYAAPDPGPYPDRWRGREFEFAARELEALYGIRASAFFIPPERHAEMRDWFLAWRRASLFVGDPEPKDGLLMWRGIPIRERADVAPGTMIVCGVEKHGKLTGLAPKVEP